MASSSGQPHSWLRRLAQVRHSTLIAAIAALVVLQIAVWVAAVSRPGASQAAALAILASLATVLLLWAAMAAREAELRASHQRLAEAHRQLLAAHDIGAEIASAEDIQQVLELAARAPVRLAGALGSAFITFDEELDRLHLDMAWGLSGPYVEGLRRRVEHGIPAERCRQCQPLQARVSSDCPLFEGLQPLAAAEGIQSLVCIPLHRDQRRTGILTAYFPSPDGPPDEQVRLLNLVMAEIAAALENAQLRERQLSLLATAEHLTQPAQSLDDLSNQILQTSLTGWAASRGAILCWNEGAATWEPWALQGFPPGPDHADFSLALSLAEQARQKQEVVVAPDLGRTVRAAGGPRSAAAAPLFVNGKLVAALVMMSDQPARFNESHHDLLQAIAHQAGLAIANAQLRAQVQQMAIVEERYRLAREIHDGLAQTLGALGWQMDFLQNLVKSGDTATAAELIDAARQAVREAYKDVRETIDGLRLAVDHSGGLASVLTEYVEEFRQRTGLAVELTTPAGEVPLTPEASLQLLRIAQECLTNVRKHAAASHVWVELRSLPGRVELTVADDGRGFDPEAPRGRQHVGLVAMRERVHSLGGTLTVATRPGHGTRVTATVPTPILEPALTS